MMIDRLMPYVNTATNLVPGFGQKEAVIFTSALIAESLLRGSKTDKGLRILFLDAIKHIQFYASFAKNPLYGHSVLNKLKAHFLLLPSNIFGILIISAITGVKEWNKKYHANLEADRPPLASFVACAGEALKMGAKIVGSLATGKVVGQMVEEQLSGKVRFAVSAALLALSAWNVKAVITNK